MWSRPDVQELASKFVPATDEVWRLHHLKDPECRLFQEFMDDGIWADQAGGGSTRQGIYAVSPSGVLLADVNSTHAPAMKAMLQRALRAWDELPKGERLLPYDPETRRDQIQRQSNQFPKGGQALRVYVRDLPRPDLTGDWRGKAWNVDHAWFKPGELEGVLPKRVKKKAKQAWPKPLMLRLARLHLTDYVRGQTSPFGPTQVRSVTLETEVLKVKKGQAQVRFTGSVELCTGEWSDRPDGNETRGVKADLFGEAVYDLRKKRYKVFDLVAVGVRWGQTQFNFRGDDLAPAPIGWAFTLAPEGEVVAPANLGAYGWR